MGYVHEVAYYEDTAGLVAATAPALRQALDRDEDVALLCSDRNNRALHEALGDDERVVVLPRRQIYQKAASAIGYACDFAEERRAADRGRVTVIGEVAFGGGPRALDEWRRYEALLNHAMAPFAVSAICAYDIRALPKPVLATAGSTHPYVRRGSTRLPNPGFVDPATLLRGAESGGGVLPRSSPVLSLSVIDLPGLRRDLFAAQSVDGVAEERAEDLVTAVHEVVANGLRHGEPPVTVRLWCLPGQVVCTVTDRGPGFDDPFVGYVRGGGEPLAEGRYGLWLARQLCDEVVLAYTDEGFQTRLTIRR